MSKPKNYDGYSGKNTITEIKNVDHESIERFKTSAKRIMDYIIDGKLVPYEDLEK